MKQIQIIIILAAFCMVDAAHVERITNFTTAKTVYDFEFRGDVVWVATSGGLFNYNMKTGASSLRQATTVFPDPSIRALALDAAGNLWAGSQDGYLLMLDYEGREYINSAYVSAGWRIEDMITIGPYLVIASDKGVSLFDMKKRAVLKNATRIGTFPSAQIHIVATYKNKLYLGGESGVATLKKPVDSIADAIFYDPSIWQTDTTLAGSVGSFLPDSGKLKAFPGPTARLLTYLVEADSDTVTVNVAEPYSFKLGSAVTVIKVHGDRCWFGTEADYMYFLDAKLNQISIPGPTFASVNRVHVDRAGTLWVLPYGMLEGDPYLPPWWLGINAFDGRNTWTNFGPANHPEMGHMGVSTKAYAIAQTADDRMWFGFEGGSIKCRDPVSGSWTHYCNFGMDEQTGAFIKRKGACPVPDWGKCDAIAQDSSGYMWMGSWGNAKGCLLCYKPSPDESDSLSGTYRRFPPYGVEIRAIAVDKAQNIIYGTDLGVLSIARYTGNPLTDGITVVKTFPNLQKIFDAVVLGDGSTLVLAVSGVHRYDPDERTLTLLDDKFDKNVTTLAAENDNILWYGIVNEGLVRYDMLNNDKTVFNRAHGLISTQINDVFVDKMNGYVWVATDRGVSRLSLGYTVGSSSGKKALVFPNPFSRNLHDAVFFQNIPIDASVGVYGLNGNLVATPELVQKGEEGACYQWKPSSRMAPGTYFYAIVTSSSRKTGKMILTP